MLVLAVKKFYLIVSDSPTIRHILCAEFMQMNVQGFVGMHRRSMTVVYVKHSVSLAVFIIQP